MEKELAKALQYCFYYLSFRSRTNYEMQCALKKKGFSEEISAQALAYCQNKKLINDAVFAENWIIARQNGTLRGPKMVKQELLEKRIAYDIIEEKLLIGYSVEKERAVVEKAMRKKFWPLIVSNCSDGDSWEERFAEKQKVKDKIFRFFLSKGFHFHVVEAVYNRLYAEELDNYK